MDLDWIWKAVLIVLGGTFLLRIAGRKSISQMTLAQTVIMIGIGSLLVQPLAGKNIWITLAVGSILVLTLIAMEYGQIKSDAIEKFITGKSKVLVENGTIHEKNLRKLRMTVDQLEMKLRQSNVNSISDLQWATLEANGQIGYQLKPESQPVTKKEFDLLRQDIQKLVLLLEPRLTPILQNPTQQEDKEDIFKEVSMKSHDNPPPKHLQ
jgi:uncharacterized membrane protein YcaP (DUF421 family)